jgi:hypothetical protein
MESKFIEIKDATFGTSKSTKTYSIYSKSSRSQLGKIEYYSPWRQYVFTPDMGSVWSVDCLAFVSEKLNELNTKKGV